MFDKTNIIMSRMIINGIVITGSTSSIVMQGGKVFVNGVQVGADTTNDPDKKRTVTVTVDDVAHTFTEPVILKIEAISVSSVDSSSAPVEIKGDVGNVRTTSGDVDISGSVSGDVQTTSGNVTAPGNVRQVKTTSGNVTVHGDVSGDVGTVSGDVRAQKITGKCTSVTGSIRV